MDTKTLECIISGRIHEKGLISFAEFMDLALYHPELGYYSKNKTSDDYYTSADVHPIFAKVLARFFYEEWKKSFLRFKQFNLIELGCGTGKLALEILNCLKANAPECYSRLKYTGVEISPNRRNACEKILAEHRESISPFPKGGSRGIYPSIEIVKDYDFPDNSLDAIVFSNEFFDALPFHRVINKDGSLRELLIDTDFKEISASPSLLVRDFFNWLGIEPEEGHTGEAHVASRTWLEKVGRSLKSGLVLTIDYGFDAQELYSSLRPEGTALCHHNHQTSRNFYSHLGKQDITSHINFSALMKEGENWGLKSSPLRTQSDFLLENGLEDMVKEMSDMGNSIQRLKTSSAIKSLIHPEGMGGVFKVLIQRKHA